MPGESVCTPTSLVDASAFKLDIKCAIPARKQTISAGKFAYKQLPLRQSAHDRHNPLLVYFPQMLAHAL